MGLDRIHRPEDSHERGIEGLPLFPHSMLFGVSDDQEPIPPHS